MKWQETDDIDGWEEVEWELTTEGQRMFPRISIHEHPPKAQAGASGRWWDQ